MAPTYAETALAALRAGDIRTAYKKAVHACQIHSNQDDLQKLGSVFYAHGKLLTSEGRLTEATSNFTRAVKCTDRNETFRLRARTAGKALRHQSRPIVQRRLEVSSFCQTMSTRINLSLSNLPTAPFLHVVRKAQCLHPPMVALREAPRLDEFHALGTYRWQGDEKSSDLFTRWIRRLKSGDRAVATHLARLLGDWICAKASVLQDADFLVTVPGDPQREAQRGFNPPDVLAEALQECVGIPIRKGVLARSRSSRARDSSYTDVVAGFHRGKKADSVNGWRVILLDDVATRGYTLRACSDRLQDAGAKRVVCVVLAQAVTTRREREAAGSEAAFPR